MLNQVTLVGRITADPELKESPNGRSFCIITLETKRSFKNVETNEYETDLIDIGLWGYEAEKVVRRCGKGSAIVVRGRLEGRILDLPDKQTIRTISVIGGCVSIIQSRPPKSVTKTEE